MDQCVMLTENVNLEFKKLKHLWVSIVSTYNKSSPETVGGGGGECFLGRLETEILKVKYNTDNK